MANKSGRAHSFGAWLGQQRQGRNLTQAELAQRLHCALGTLRKIEQDERRPSRALAERIATVLGMLPQERATVVQGARGEVPIDRLPLLTPLVGAAVPGAAAAASPQCHQLRTPLPDFIGRQAALTTLLAALRQATEDGAVAAISGVRGMGGIGKTELAYLAANRLIDAFPDAQIVVQMHGMRASPLSSTQAMQQIIYAFTPDAKLSDDMEVLQQHYRSVLYGKHVLILADDVKDASQVQPLLPPTGCALLITSRQRFSLPGMTTIDLDVLDEADTVTLLRSICPRLDDTTAPALAHICSSLPLALRVSGSILANDLALEVPTYIQHLRDERQGLAHLRDPDDPGLDVAATLALSYTQLAEGTQQVFRQLAVFVTDFATEMALAVVKAPPGIDVVEELRVLLRRNLVMYDITHTRWRLHDLVRELALTYLEAAREAEATLWHYAQVAIQVAQALHEQYLAGSAGALAALARFDAERPHIDAARRWATAHAGTPDGDQLLLDEGMATSKIGYLRYDRRREIFPQWECVRAAAQRLSDWRAEGYALFILGNASNDLGDIQRAMLAYEQALTIFRAIGDRQHEGIILSGLGCAYYCLEDNQRAILAQEQALMIAREIGEQHNEGIALGYLGRAYVALGDARRAIAYFEQCLINLRALGDQRDEGYALYSLGEAYLQLGDIQYTIACCEASRTIACALGDRRMEGYALSYLAPALAHYRDLAHATAVFEQALTLLRDSGAREGEAECQWRFGLALAHQGQREQALPLLHASLGYIQELGHAKAAEQAALLARIEAGEPLAPEVLDPVGERAVGARAGASRDNDDAD